MFRISPASAGLFYAIDRIACPKGNDGGFKEDFVRFSLQKHWELILIDKQNNILNWGNNKHKIIFNRKVTKPNNKTLRFLTIRHLDFIMVTVMRST